MRKLIIFLVLFLVSCGIIRESRTSEAVAPVMSEGTREKDAPDKGTREVVYRSAFTKEYLYKKAKQRAVRTPKRYKSASATTDVEETFDDEEYAAPKEYHEIIRVVDERGTVVATKRVK